MARVIARHAAGETWEDFEDSLIQVIDFMQDAGYHIVGISHATTISTTDTVVYSAVIWAKEEATGGDT